MIPRGLRWHYLQDQLIELFDLNIYGTPWQLPFWGAFNLCEKDLKRQYMDITANIDVFLSHGPIFGIGDEVPSRNSADPYHTGSRSLQDKILEIKPKLFICGHIHCAFGVCIEDNITFANVCLLNDQMEVVNKPAIFKVNLNENSNECEKILKQSLINTNCLLT
jgi:hypothetical protein